MTGEKFTLMQYSVSAILGLIDAEDFVIHFIGFYTFIHFAIFHRKIKGIKWLSGLCASPIFPLTCAPQALK